MATEQLPLWEFGDSGLFQAGGNILLNGAIVLFFEKPDGSAAHVKTAWDISHCEQFRALLDACKPATFGKGSDEVLDPNYRSAMCLAPDKFAINHPLPSAELLHDIHQLLQPAATFVRAELYKLNIYGPGGHFKSHVDTPRGPNMFGSLVICLPSDHKGGDLVLRRPSGKQHTYSWGRAQSGEGQAAGSSLQWAAFYSDVEHEILPVTEGYRVTLTYNLYSIHNSRASASDPLQTADVVSNSAFGQALAARLRDNDWYPEGTTLGFTLDHKYAQDSQMPEMLEPSMLKGTDLLLYQVLAQLELDVKIVPVVSMDRGDRRGELFVGDSFGAGDSGYDYWDFENGTDTEADVLAARHGFVETDNIIWVKEEPHWFYEDSITAYGNDPHTHSWYVDAALLVEVPECPRGSVQPGTALGKRARTSESE